MSDFLFRNTMFPDELLLRVATAVVHDSEHFSDFSPMASMSKDWRGRMLDHYYKLCPMTISDEEVPVGMLPFIKKAK